MTIKSLITECNYKYFFNGLYKFYLKNNSNERVQSIDELFRRFYFDASKAFTSTEIDSKFKIYISALGDKKIDVSILDAVSDELQETKNFKLQSAANFEIITSAKMNKHEILAHAVWAFKHELI